MSTRRFNTGFQESYLDMDVGNRCIIRRRNEGGGHPYLPAIYNNMAQILQAPGYVVIYAEMIHFARVIPVDGRPPLPDTVETWLGDPRGRWEGDTLVVETRNFVGSNAHMVGRTGVVYGNANPETFSIVERFTRTGPETIDYRVTIADPGNLDAAVHDLGAVEQDRPSRSTITSARKRTTTCTTGSTVPASARNGASASTRTRLMRWVGSKTRFRT